MITTNRRRVPVSGIASGVVFAASALSRCAPLANAAPAGDFWTTWGDGRAEVSGYDLRKNRYGKDRAGHAVLIFVTEDWNDAIHVKAEHRSAETLPVLKLNHIAKFQTGIYDYSLMTSVFADAASPAWPLRKVSFSSQEWCGHVYHQILFPPGGVHSTSHSYFEGEADQSLDLPFPADGVSEDALPILLRGFPGRPDLLHPGERREAPLLPALSRVRLRHLPLRWWHATLVRAAAAAPVRTPAGVFAAIAYDVVMNDGQKEQDRGVFYMEAAAPHRVLGWRWNSGEEALLRGTARLPYWKLNAPGGEAALQQLGLVPVYPAAPPVAPPLL